MFDFRRLNVRTKALFAEECALVAQTKSELHATTEHFDDGLCLFSLTISLSKIVV